MCRLLIIINIYQKTATNILDAKFVLKGNQADTLLSEVIDHGQQFPDGSAQLVQLIHHQRVTLSDEKKQFFEYWPLIHAGLLLCIDLLAPCMIQSLYLHIEVLCCGDNSCVASYMY